MDRGKRKGYLKTKEKTRKNGDILSFIKKKKFFKGKDTEDGFKKIKRKSFYKEKIIRKKDGSVVKIGKRKLVVKWKRKM